MNTLSTSKSNTLNKKGAIILPLFTFRVSSNTATVPTTTTGTSYTITNTGSVAMINDATRGFVFSLTGGNCLSVAVTTPLNTTKSFWLSSSTPASSGGNAFSTTKCPIWFNGGTFLKAGVNHPSPTNVFSTIAQTSTWLFYTITTSDTTTTMYVNGTQVATASVAWTGDTTTMYFGAYQGANFLTGRMDDIRFYSSILTATEINALYTTTLL